MNSYSKYSKNAKLFRSTNSRQKFFNVIIANFKNRDITIIADMHFYFISIKIDL